MQTDIHDSQEVVRAKGKKDKPLSHKIHGSLLALLGYVVENSGCSHAFDVSSLVTVKIVRHSHEVLQTFRTAQCCDQRSW